ncbi:MAG: glutamyl-tRNA reductase [Bacteroidota bacterium]
MNTTFKVLALSYKNTPLAIRELLAFDEAGVKSFMNKLRAVLGIQESLILSTCNRTEIYYTSEHSVSQEVCKLLKVEKGLATTDVLEQYFTAIENTEEATRHLFRVSMGLEAKVVGDIQISNQVKNAYQWSADESMAGPFLHRLMHTIFFANKRVVQETAFRDGAASVSYAAVSYIKELSSSVANPKILVLGLGEIGEDVARNLSSHGKGEVFLCNRTHAKAEELATELGFQTIPFESYQPQLRQFDVVISSIRAEKPIIEKVHLNTAEVLTHKFFLDLSVPRSIAADVEEVPGVLLYNIDTIQERADETLENRIKAIPEVERITEESLAELHNWSREMEVSPTIQKLKGALEEIRQAELARHLKKMSDKEIALMDTVTKSMMQKIIKLPVLNLKAACKRGEAETLIDVLNDLFDLEKQARNSK